MVRRMPCIGLSIRTSETLCGKPRGVFVFQKTGEQWRTLFAATRRGTRILRFAQNDREGREARIATGFALAMTGNDGKCGQTGIFKLFFNCPPTAVGAEAGISAHSAKAGERRTQNAFLHTGRQQTGQQDGDGASGENTRRKTGSAKASPKARVCAAPTNDKTARRASTGDTGYERTGRISIRKFGGRLAPVYRYLPMVPGFPDRPLPRRRRRL